jgi:hypothetical protein
MKPASKKGPAILLALLILLTGSGIRMQGQDTDEHGVEAVYLFHFAQLVDWPPDAESSTENSIFLCTVGDDPFQGALEEAVAGKPVGNRAIRIRHLDETQDVQSCQIAFIGKAEAKHLSALLTTLHNAPVLTVGDSPNFLEAGGMIRFVLEDNKVRFDINLVAAQAARLKIGSRLLVLAQHVVGEGHDK